MNPISGLFNYLYFPICRAYRRHILADKPADLLMSFLYSIYFFRVHWYWPNFKKPRSFEEKLSNRILYDRHPKWTEISDKLRVRDYVAARVGREYLIPHLWHGDKPEEIPFDDLPSKYVIKTNHGCGFNILVNDKQQINKGAIVEKLKKWLATNYCLDIGLGTSWGYNNIKPNVIIEEFIGDSEKAPEDYKFFCFSGRAEYLQMNFDRFGDPYEKTFDRDFNPLDLWQGTKQYPGQVMKPKNYEDMIRISESLAMGFDFIRVDLYNVGGQIYFGELTCYPGGGNCRWIPRKYDYLLGDKWMIRSTHDNT